MKQSLVKLNRVLLGGFVLVALGLIYWQIIRAQPLLARDDNPRLVIAEQHIKRGKILTPTGIPLAETITDADGIARRRYPYPYLAAVTGYYSIRYGTGGLEAAFDPILRGQDQQTPLDSLLHRPPQGRPITVTIHFSAQITADSALAGSNTTGAVVVLNTVTGELLVMASRPSFDPNHLDEDWNNLIQNPAAPLLNRATQGRFPLGELTRLVGLIGLFEAGTTIPPDPLTAPLLPMLAPLSGQGLAATARQLQFDKEISFSLPTAAGYIPANLPDKAQEIAATPLHLALMGAAMQQNGLAPTPTLIKTPSTPPQAIRLFGNDTAAWIITIAPEFSALAATDVTGSQPLSWYLGFTPDAPSLVVVAVVTTPTGDRLAARRVALATLNAIDNP